MQLLPIVLAVSGVWPGRLNLPMAQTCFCCCCLIIRYFDIQ